MRPKNALKHGHSAGGKTSRTYNSWASMLQRVQPDYHHAEDYHGRGIIVCERWHSFDAFLEDMGERPMGTTLDRKNNDSGYDKHNCRWATGTVQRLNSRPRPVNATCRAGHPKIAGDRACKQCRRATELAWRIQTGRKKS